MPSLVTSLLTVQAFAAAVPTTLASVARPPGQHIAERAQLQGKYEADVIVYGATAAGVMAAIAASRSNASVLLLNPYPALGGMPAAGGLVSTDVMGPELVGGLAGEFFLAAARLYNASATLPLSYAQMQLEAKVATAVFHWMLGNATAVRVVNTTYITGVDTVPTPAGPAVTCLHAGAQSFCATGSPSRSSAAGLPGVFIDATYEGDLLVTANVSTVMGREPAAQYNESRGGVTTAYAQCSQSIDPVDFCMPVSPFDATGALLP